MVRKVIFGKPIAPLPCCEAAAERQPDARYPLEGISWAETFAIGVVVYTLAEGERIQ